MSYAGNTPSSGTVLRLEARKSFSFSLWVKTHNRHPVDLTGCTLRLVVKRQSEINATDSANLVVNSEATIVSPTVGYARFDLQASDVDLASAEYPFAIVLTTAAGYSAVVVKGVVDVQENAESASVATTYAGGDPPTSLEVRLRDMTTVEVLAGHVLPPGMNYMSDMDKTQLDELVEQFLGMPPFGTAAFLDRDDIVPAGGAAGRVLGKTSPGDYDVGWLPMGDTTGLDLDYLVTDDVLTFVPDEGAPTGTNYTIETDVLNLEPDGAMGYGVVSAFGVADGRVPTANGDDTWSWKVPGTPTADDIVDSATKVMMTAAERAKLADIEENAQANVQSDWNATSGMASIANKPTLGTAAAAAAEDFAADDHTHRVIDLSGISRGTADPTGGVDGDLYLKRKV